MLQKSTTELKECVSVLRTIRFNVLECFLSRAHKNGRLEWERVTLIEARTLVKIIEVLLEIEHPAQV